MIPLWMAEKAYEMYDKLYHNDQTLARIGERHGFGWIEFCMLYCGEKPQREISLKVIARCTNTVIADLTKYF